MCQFQCTYILIYTYIRIYVYYIWIHICVSVYVNIYLYIYIHICMDTYIYIHTYVHIYGHVCIHKHSHKHTHTHTHTHTNTHTHTFHASNLSSKWKLTQWRSRHFRNLRVESIWKWWSRIWSLDTITSPEPPYLFFNFSKFFTFKFSCLKASESGGHAFGRWTPSQVPSPSICFSICSNFLVWKHLKVVGSHLVVGHHHKPRADIFFLENFWRWLSLICENQKLFVTTTN